MLAMKRQNTEKQAALVRVLNESEEKELVDLAPSRVCNS